MGPVVVHSSDTISYANAAFCALVGATSTSEVLDRRISSFTPESYRDNLRTQFDDLLRGDPPAHALELELDHVDGSQREVVAVSSPVEWDDVTQIQTTFVPLVDTADSDILSVREDAMNQAPVGITIADATREDLPLIYVNDAFIDITGYSRDEILGENCRVLQGEKTQAEPVRKMREAIAAEEPVTVELRNYRNDGSLFWNRVTISPIEDEDGAVKHFVGFQEDISDRKLYEQEKTLFEKYAETSDQVMFTTDVDGTIEYVNPAFERVTGYTDGEAIGENPRLLKSAEQDPSFYEDLPDTIGGDGIWGAEITNRAKSGELYDVHQTIVPISNGSGEVTHYIAIERSITDERIKAQVLDVLNRVLRHNVRTSINVIDGYAEQLEGGLPPDQKRIAISAIRDRTTDLRKVSEQLTAIQNLLEGRASSSPLGLDHMERVVDKIRMEYPDASISLSSEVEPTLEIKNGSIFQIALETAIENAITHCDQDQPVVDIRISGTTDVDRLAVEIADNGPGIPDCEWEIIRAGAETPLQHTSGVGLWILYWSVTALGGTVERSENEPRGTVLTLEIPIVDTSA